MSYRFKEPGQMDRMDDMRPPVGSNMNDPKLSEQRGFGGMDNDKPSRDDMEGRFSKFDSGRGRRAVSYGRGRRMSPPRDKPFSERSRDFGYGRDDMPPMRDRSPLRGSGGGGGGGFEDRYSDRFKKDDMPYPRRDELLRKDSARPFLDEPYRDKFMGPEGRGRYDSPTGFSSRFEPPDDQFKNRPFNYPGAPYKDFYKSDMAPKPNECEIIVINKQQRAYAENVEQRMKNLGIQVDILFLKDEALLVQTIDDIARRGSLYAIVISPLNETHGSVTLNILYGTPQEHRNMPLDDALKLVARNFHDHIRTQRETMDRDRTDRGFYSGALPADREIQFLLHLLADGRSVTLPELEMVLRYLTERRDKMKSPQGDRGTSAGGVPPDSKMLPPPKPKEEEDIAQKEQDLQNRIMNIISQGPPSADVGRNPPAGMGNEGLGANIPGMGSESVNRSNIPGLGPKPGMGPGQQGMGPNMGGMGSNQGAMGPDRPGGMGPDRPGGMGPDRPGSMGPDRPGGMGPDRPGGMGPDRPGGMGPNQQINASNRPGMGLDQPGMGPGNRPGGMPQNQPGGQGLMPPPSGIPGMGPNQQNIGPNQPGMGKNQPGLGPNQPTNLQSSTGPNQQPPASTYINFDNPSVQKALDSLLQSGPMIKNITMGGNNPPASQGMQDNSQMKMASNMGNMGGMGPQRGLGGMNDRGMGMGPQGGNMGPPPGMGPNMGHGPMSGMGPGHYGSGQNQPGGYGNNPNMMGNMSRPSYMGHMSNQGMGGGPRRY